jgi:hypothetical protein
MELYVKMTDEEYEEYKVLRENKCLYDNASIEEYLKINGFKEQCKNEGFNPELGKPTRLTIYKNGVYTVKIEKEIL